MSCEIKHLGVHEQLQRMREWLLTEKPFLHARFNDGECAAMFRVRPPEATASSEHHFFHDVGDAMVKAVLDVAAHLKTDPAARIIVGQHMAAEPHCPCAQAFMKFVDEHQLATLIPWGADGLWYNTQLELAGVCAGQELLDLMEAIKTRRPVVLVGNKYIAGACRCLGAKFIEAPAVDAWLKYAELWKACEPSARDNAVFVWCAGFPAKVLACNLWLSHPNSTHIDFGSQFDGIFGRNSRRWMARAYQEHYTHWRFYSEQFARFVRGNK